MRRRVKLEERRPRKTKIGIVVKKSSDKTICVKVQDVKTHARFKKTIKIFKKYLVHDELGQSVVGDNVVIASSRPISKLKNWRLLNIVGSAQSVSSEGEVA